ncbi:hypothetical protein [Chitinophaga defluvii]|uniref:Glutathione peroxidase n=1 Tax=Chitinophaga defluvii TaxID=3163343 RepID=A0ABV2TBD1_9BACT
MTRIILFLFAFPAFVNIYGFSFNDAKGNLVPLRKYEGRKILMVNISTGNPKSYQLRGLQELYRLYKDSLVIIGVPSNSFGNEPHTPTEIDKICKEDYGVQFLITQPENVIGTTRHPIYQWLLDSAANGVGPIHIREDFQKILFDKTGNVMGVYSAQVDPLDSSVQKAILGIY